LSHLIPVTVTSRHLLVTLRNARHNTTTAGPHNATSGTSLDEKSLQRL